MLSAREQAVDSSLAAETCNDSTADCLMVLKSYGREFTEAEIIVEGRSSIGTLKCLNLDPLRASRRQLTARQRRDELPRQQP